MLMCPYCRPIQARSPIHIKRFQHRSVLVPFTSCGGVPIRRTVGT
ncbi:hypothetical protein WG66_014919 [Moniliophthora roreri]|nr:hypothetical protein WG66_014919 [Moniliophthora roreri]